MQSMVSYSHRLQSGHITCYFNRTFDVLPTPGPDILDTSNPFRYSAVAFLASRGADR
jgi:hypothetical protein